MMRSTLSYAQPASVTPEPPASGVRLSGGYSRARCLVERRTAVLRTAPALFGEVESGELPDARSIDPFGHAPEHLPARTRAVVACAACTNHGALPEADPSCLACEGTGRMAVWVDIEVLREQRVIASGAGEARDRHQHLLDPADFDTGEWPNQLLHQAWLRGLPPHLCPSLRPKLRADERVLWILVQTFVG